MFSGKVLWFIVGLFTGSSIGFITASLLAAAGSEERKKNSEVKFDVNTNTK